MYNTIAIISDIHSNSTALRAVLSDIKKRRADVIVNLGDSLFGPIDPVGTAELFRELENAVHIMGNCDEALLQEASESPTFKFVKPLLAAEVLQWIKEFHKIWIFEDLLFCHGTPFSNNTYLLEQLENGRVSYKKGTVLAAELNEIKQRYIFCGHSHQVKSVYLPDGKLVINAGSVGLPAYYEEEPQSHAMESLSPYADYVVCSRTAEGEAWKIEHVMLPYDWNEAASIAESNGRHDYAAAIRTGRALV